MRGRRTGRLYAVSQSGIVHTALPPAERTDGTRMRFEVFLLGAKLKGSRASLHPRDRAVIIRGGLRLHLRPALCGKVSLIQGHSTAEASRRMVQGSKVNCASWPEVR